MGDFEARHVLPFYVFSKCFAAHHEAVCTNVGNFRFQRHWSQFSVIDIIEDSY